MILSGKSTPISAGLLALWICGCASPRSRAPDDALVIARTTSYDVQSTSSRYVMQESSEAWICPMHPDVRQPDPGVCPLCGMNLNRAGDSPGGGPPAPNRRPPKPSPASGSSCH